MPYYEFTLGIYVEARDEDDAWEKLEPVQTALNKLDAEESASVELVSSYDSLS